MESAAPRPRLPQRLVLLMLLPVAGLLAAAALVHFARQLEPHALAALAWRPPRSAA